MSVSEREYKHSKTRRPAWGYAFSYRKVRYREAGFRTRKDAQDAEDKKRKEVIFDKKRSKPSAKTTFSETVDRFLTYRAATRAEGTVQNEKRRFNVLNRTFGRMRLTRISTSDIQRHVERRKADGKANRSVNLELTALRSLFDYAIQNDLANDNPAKRVKNLPETRTEKQVPSEGQFDRFVSEAMKSGGLQLVVWLWFRAFTGTRPRESFYVEWGDINFETNRISIRPKNGNSLKNRRFRYVDMHPELRCLLEAWRAEWVRYFQERTATRAEAGKPSEENHDWVFFHPRRPYRRAGGFRRNFLKAREAAGIPWLTSHGLRHYFISNAVMSGVDLLTIAKWVGHSSTKMIEQTYGHLSPEYRAQQMLKVKLGNVSLPASECLASARILRGAATAAATGRPETPSLKKENSTQPVESQRDLKS